MNAYRSALSVKLYHHSYRRRIVRLLLFLLALLRVTAVQAQVVTLPPGPAPQYNPLKGWAPYPAHAASASMAFLYVPWKALEPQPGVYAFDDWERREWNAPALRGKQIVFRVYLDFPGSASGIPSWLLSAGLRTKRYHAPRDLVGAGSSPNYADKRLIAGIERLIAALGKRYDGDPRVAFIELGLLGFWGEWHTEPFPQLFASEAVQARVLRAYQNAFPRTKLLARYAVGPAGRQAFSGFHDDYFPIDTERNAYRDDPRSLFLPQLESAGRSGAWKNAPVGGEMVPGAARRLLTREWPMTLSAAQHGHFSWLGPYTPLAARLRGAAAKHAAVLEARLGYVLRLTSIDMASTAAPGQPITLTIEGANIGFAPFYYPWPVQLAWIGPGGKIVDRAAGGADIRSWLPGAFSFSAALTAPKTPGEYRLALGIINPRSGEPEVRLANTLDIVGGWHVLAPVSVR